MRSAPCFVGRYNRPYRASPISPGETGRLTRPGKTVADSVGLVHIVIVFRLTKQEKQVVAFLVGAILLGTAVRQWRARQETKKAGVMAGDARQP